MIKNSFTLILLSAALICSCQDSSLKQSERVKENNSEAKVSSDEIVQTTLYDSTGKKLEMIFNNTKNIATLKFDNEKIELNGQRAASGIWYKNENYELRGKGDKIELQKNGKTVFKN